MNNSISSTTSSVFTTLFVFLSSACCVGPLIIVFSFIGLSGSTILAIENTVGPFRPLVLGLTTALLATGFYFAYRPQKEVCEPGKICELRILVFSSFRFTAGAGWAQSSKIVRKCCPIPGGYRRYCVADIVIHFRPRPGAHERGGDPGILETEADCQCAHIERALPTPEPDGAGTFDIERFNLAAFCGLVRGDPRQ